MAVHEGITLIVGGGYHGKSTLLEALQMGVYDHIAGDGREYVFSDVSSVKSGQRTAEAYHRPDSGFVLGRGQEHVPGGALLSGIYTACPKLGGLERHDIRQGSAMSALFWNCRNQTGN